MATPLEALRWLLPVYTVPSTPSRLRAAVWRSGGPEERLQDRVVARAAAGLGSDAQLAPAFVATAAAAPEPASRPGAPA